MFITKSRLVKEISKIYQETESQKANTKEEFLRKCEVHNKLNLLCSRLNIKPPHLNELDSKKLYNGFKTILYILFNKEEELK